MDAKTQGPRPSPLVGEVRAYSPPGFPHPVDLELDANEGALPPARLLDVPVRIGPELLRRYPDASRLEGMIADRIGADAERVLVTAGGDDAIERAIRSVLCPGREMILPVPTFGMFARYSRLTGCDVAEVDWPDGPWPVEAVMGALGEKTALVVVVSPNSPTGLVADPGDVERVARAAPGALVLVDLAYVEFADEDPTGRMLELPNVLVVRSMSKAWGLAGLRVGWAAGPAGVIAWLRAAGHPYAVSSTSLAIAEESLRTRASEMARFVERVRFERRDLTGLLRDRGVRVWDSQANFVLARFHDGLAVWEGLSRRGIGVRRFPGKDGLEGCLRITLPGDPDDHDRLARALGEILDGREG